jgi:hypothetical protein
MTSRTTLKEIRETLAAAKGKKGPKTAVAPVVGELESLAQLLEREVDEGQPVEKPRKKKAGSAADGGDRRGSTQSPRTRGG